MASPNPLNPPEDPGPVDEAVKLEIDRLFDEDQDRARELFASLPGIQRAEVWGYMARFEDGFERAKKIHALIADLILEVFPLVDGKPDIPDYFKRLQEH